MSTQLLPTPSILPTPTPDPTSLGAAQAAALRSSTAEVAFLNADLKARYLSAFADYTTNMTSGEFIPEDRRVPPKPPYAWELAPPDANGMVWYQIGTTPVTDQPPTPSYNAGNAPPNAVPNMMLIGNREGNTKWFQALPGDTFPNGQVTPPSATSAEGVKGPFEKFGAVAGYGWYLQVS